MHNMPMAKDDGQRAPGDALVPGLHARLWLVNEAGDNWVGIGRVQLLRAIEQTGSIRQAARQLGMSYKRAWSLVEALNALGPEPMVVKEAGGRHGGGTVVTDYGRATLELYARMEAHLKRCAEAIERDIARWQRGEKGERHD